MSPAIVPPAFASFSFSNSASAAWTVVACIFPVAVDVTSAAVWSVDAASTYAVVATLVELSPAVCVVAVVAVLIVPLRFPLNVVAVIVPALEILFAPILMSPAIVPPVRCNALSAFVPWLAVA